MAARYIRVPSPYRYIVIVDLPSGEIRLSEHVEDSKIQEFLDVHCPGVDFDPSEEGLIDVQRPSFRVQIRPRHFSTIFAGWDP